MRLVVQDAAEGVDTLSPTGQKESRFSLLKEEAYCQNSAIHTEQRNVVLPLHLTIDTQHNGNKFNM